MVFSVYGDGNSVIKQHPFQLYAQGAVHAQALMYGVNSYDGLLFLPHLYMNMPLPASDTEIIASVQAATLMTLCTTTLPSGSA